MFLKHYKNRETILTIETNYSLGKLTLPVPPASSLFVNVMLI